MEYLKRYGLTEQEILKLKDTYNKRIIEYIEDNQVGIIDIIEYLNSIKIKCIYWLMINNINVFLETKLALQTKIEKMKNNGLSIKQIQMKLLQER